LPGKDYEDHRRICQADPSTWSGDFFDHLFAAGVIMVIALSLAVVAHLYSNRIGRG
jgi:hypothetical protein